MQAIIEVDIESYNNIIGTGKLLVGYDSCKVWDATQIRRCFKCSGFNHMSTQCKQKEPTCSKCSHLLKECQSSSLKCVNCMSLKEKKSKG